MSNSSASLVLMAGLLLAAAASAQDAGQKPLLQDTAGNCPSGLTFTHVLTNAPLPVMKADKAITPAVERFHCTGENQYNADQAAIAEGQTLYRLCGTCHGARGEGRIGPRLNDATVKYERVATEQGAFEVIYGGAAGAMQPMGRRFDQDQILKIMAYVESLGGS